MNAVLGTYDNFGKSLAAFEELVRAGFPAKKISLIGLLMGNRSIDESTHVNHDAAGRMIAQAMRDVSEAAIFTVPEYGFLFAAGGVISTISRLNRTDEFAGLNTILQVIGIDSDLRHQYTTRLEAGKYLIIAHGSSHEITIASEVLTKHISYSEAEGNHVKSFDLSEWISNLDTNFPLSGGSKL